MYSQQSSRNYYKVDEFGHSNKKEADPWNYCLINDRFYSDIDEQYGPTSNSCREFLAERCADGWDNVCNVYSINKDPSVPDQLLDEYGYPDEAQHLPEGKKHILRTFARKYCRLVNDLDKNGGIYTCRIKKGNFNNNVVHTPQILQDVYGDCNLACDLIHVNEKEPYDPIVYEILKDENLRKLASQKILQLCKNAKMQGKKLKGYLGQIDALL